MQGRADVDELYANSKRVFSRTSREGLLCLYHWKTVLPTKHLTGLLQKSRSRSQSLREALLPTSILVHIIGGFIATSDGSILV